jgi:hypothetical protein
VEDQLVNALEAKEQTSRELVQVSKERAGGFVADVDLLVLQVMEEREQALEGAKEEIGKLLTEMNGVKTELELAKETVSMQAGELAKQQESAAEDEELLLKLRQQLAQTKEQLRTELQRDSPEYVLQLRRELRETKKALTMGEATIHALHKEFSSRGVAQPRGGAAAQDTPDARRNAVNRGTPDARRNNHESSTAGNIAGSAKRGVANQQGRFIDDNLNQTTSARKSKNSVAKASTSQGGKSGFRSDVRDRLRQRRQQAASSAGGTGTNTSIRSNRTAVVSRREEEGVEDCNNETNTSQHLMRRADEAGALAGQLAHKLSPYKTKPPSSSARATAPLRFSPD